MGPDARNRGGRGGQAAGARWPGRGTAPGSIIDFAIRQATDGTLYYRPVVVFALPDGAQRRLQLTEESAAPAYEVDEAVTIAYDAERPENARIKTSTSTAAMWILPLIMGILGAAFLGGSAVRSLGSAGKG